MHQVMWKVGAERLQLTSASVEQVDGTVTVGLPPLTDWWGLGYAEPTERVSAGEPVVTYHRPRFVDELSYDEQATVLTEARQVNAVSAQLADRRRWLDEGFHAVNNDMVIVGLESAKGHILVVKAWRAGWYMPGSLGRWQKFRMERYEAESYIDLGGGEDLAGLANDGAELGFKWAAQLQQQLAYDLEGTGWDGQGDVVKWDNPSRLKAPESVTPRPGRHPGWDRPPTDWKVAKLPKTRAYDRSPFAGMRSRGTDPHRYEEGRTVPNSE